MKTGWEVWKCWVTRITRFPPGHSSLLCQLSLIAVFHSSLYLCTLCTAFLHNIWIFEHNNCAHLCTAFVHNIWIFEHNICALNVSCFRAMQWRRQNCQSVQSFLQILANSCEPCQSFQFLPILSILPIPANPSSTCFTCLTGACQIALSTWYLVSVRWHLVPVRWPLVHDTWHLVHGIWHLVHTYTSEINSKLVNFSPWCGWHTVHISHTFFAWLSDNGILQLWEQEFHFQLKLVLKLCRCERNAYRQEIAKCHMLIISSGVVSAFYTCGIAVLWY